MCLGNLQNHELARDAFLDSIGRGACNLFSENYLTSLLATDDIDKALRSFDMVFHGASEREQGVILENMVEAIRRGQVERCELPERLRELIGNVEVI